MTGSRSAPRNTTSTRLISGDDFRRLRDLGDWWVAPFYSEDFRKDAAIWRLGPLATSSTASRSRARHRPPCSTQTRSYIRDEIRPFHWEIEFPEVFFD